MEVKHIDTYSAQSLQKIQEQQKHVRTEEKTSSQETSTGADRVQLSKRYQEMSQSKKVGMERNEVRSEKIDQLQTMIQNGSYEVDPDKVAEKMLGEII